MAAEIDAMASDFLFTWKPDRWPYEKLRTLIERFEAGDTVIERWRCRAHRQVRNGARGYLYNQGPGPNGIFGIAQVIGSATKRANVQDGEGEYEAPLRFDLLPDPTKGNFLITKEDILAFPGDVDLGNQSSGISLPESLARAIDEKINTQNKRADSNIIPESKRERLAEVYERDQNIINELKRLYDGRCQICGSAPFNGMFGTIAEGHHIVWMCRGGKDIRENIVLLCPNHHSAIHAANPLFCQQNLEFKFANKVLPIRLNKHLE